MPPKSKPKRKTPTTTDNNAPKKKIARGTDEWAEMYRKKNAQSQKVGEQVLQANNAPASSAQLKPPTSNPKPPTAVYRLPPADANASQHSLASYISYRNSMSVYQPTNAIDEVMNEVEQLLQAASEAQALGRLRNSYSSLLLAHQRLVGLGSRVDRSYCEAETTPTTQTQPTTTEGGECSNLSTTSQQLKQPTFLPPLVSQPPLPPSLSHNNYTDVAYVEYLAKSGMELHHKRTGRGMQHEAALERASNKKDQKAAAAAAKSSVEQEDCVAAGEKETPTKRKGGRGKKPPTLVMATMAGRNFDVHDLMQGVL